MLNAADASGDLAGVRVVAAFLGGSPDIASSRDRVAGFVKTLKEMDVEIVDSIPALLAKVDVVLLESVDGRVHLEQAAGDRAGKPLFIDKPLAASLADARWRSRTPGRSARRAVVLEFRCGSAEGAGRAAGRSAPCRGAAAWSPCPTEPTHPDLFWYGIHGIEHLFTLMGPGCVGVTPAHASADVVTGIWADGRVGTFRGIRDGKGDYGATVFGSKSIGDGGGYGGYEPLVAQIATFFKTRKPPVTPEETLEIMAFMEAAEESKCATGRRSNFRT